MPPKKKTRSKPTTVNKKESGRPVRGSRRKATNEKAVGQEQLPLTVAESGSESAQTAPRPAQADRGRNPVANSPFAAGIFDGIESMEAMADVALDEGSGHDDYIAVDEQESASEPAPAWEPPQIEKKVVPVQKKVDEVHPSPSARTQEWSSFAGGLELDVPAEPDSFPPLPSAPAGEPRRSEEQRASRDGRDGQEDRRGRRRGRGRWRDREEPQREEKKFGGNRRPPVPEDRDIEESPPPLDESEVIEDEDSVRMSARPMDLPGEEIDFAPQSMDEEIDEIAHGREALEPEEEDFEDAQESREPTETREMLINVADADECRIAILREGRLDELYMERAASISNVGNIYKGRVTNVEPSIQAAFIDFGKPTHGFLHISDLHPRYFPESKGEPELVGRKTPRRQRPPIQACLRRGQEVIVQVIKEGIGTKGPTLSSYISLPGRFLVMMPGMDQLGVSRKIEDEETRRRMRDVLSELSLPKDMGFIVRTAGVDRPKRDLQRDLNYLARLWSKVAKRTREEPAPAELYKESDLVIRTIRDVYDSSLKRVIVDNPTVAARVREFLSIASPKGEDVVVEYSDSEPMFHRYGIEAEIDKLHSRAVPLPSGGSLVIEQTEALVAIDVNSGRFRVPENAEETAYRVNMEAADEIARQLRLRDLGGLIICDFIDMMQDKHRRSIERRLADALRKHKERAKLLRISRFGILEMTRQRQRPSFAKSMFQECPRCNGSGRIKAIESACLDVMRQIRLASQREGVASVDVRVSSAVATELLNRKRHQLTDLERATGQTIRIHGDSNVGVDEVHISCIDRRGRDLGAGPATPPGSLRASTSRAQAAFPQEGRQGNGGGQRFNRDQRHGRGRNRGGRNDRQEGERQDRHGGRKGGRGRGR